jgi:hypothetical protein
MRSRCWQAPRTAAPSEGAAACDGAGCSAPTAVDAGGTARGGNRHAFARLRRAIRHGFGLLDARLKRLHARVS